MTEFYSVLAGACAGVVLTLLAVYSGIVIEKIENKKKRHIHKDIR